MLSRFLLPLPNFFYLKSDFFIVCDFDPLDFTLEHFRRSFNSFLKSENFRAATGKDFGLHR